MTSTVVKKKGNILSASQKKARQHTRGKQRKAAATAEKVKKEEKKEQKECDDLFVDSGGSYYYTDLDPDPMETPVEASRRKQRAVDRQEAVTRASQLFERGLDEDGLDEKGRKRQVKDRQYNESSAGEVDISGRRKWNATERLLVLAEVGRQQAKWKGKKPDALTADITAPARDALRLSNPLPFGPGCLGKGKEKGISLNDVKSIITQDRSRTLPDGRGRPPALPAAVVVAIIAALTSIVASKATLFSCSMLQPAAIGVVFAMGYGGLLTTGDEGGRGKFCASVEWIRRLT
jgi:hypothetical protein